MNNNIYYDIRDADAVIASCMLVNHLGKDNCIIYAVNEPSEINIPDNQGQTTFLLGVTVYLSEEKLTSLRNDVCKELHSFEKTLHLLTQELDESIINHVFTYINGSDTLDVSLPNPLIKAIDGSMRIGRSLEDTFITKAFNSLVSFEDLLAILPKVTEPSNDDISFYYDTGRILHMYDRYMCDHLINTVEFKDYFNIGKVPVLTNIHPDILSRMVSQLFQHHQLVVSKSTTSDGYHWSVYSKDKTLDLRLIIPSEYAPVVNNHTAYFNTLGDLPLHAENDLDIHMKRQADKVLNGLKDSKYGTLYLLVSTAGCGKTTLRDTILLHPNIDTYTDKDKFVGKTSPTTTRSSREGEVDGKDYYFTDKDTFESRVEKGMFAEHANVYGNLYGVEYSEIEESLINHEAVVHILDAQGARYFRKLEEEGKLAYNVVHLYLDSDRMDLDGRANVEERIESLKDEQSYALSADYIITNDGPINRMVGQLQSIILANYLMVK